MASVSLMPLVMVELEDATLPEPESWGVAVHSSRKVLAEDLAEVVW